MKKFILVALCAFIGTQLCAQDSIMVKVPDTAALTVREVYTDVKAGLTGIAQALKVPAEHVYGVMIKQQIVKSVVDLILILIAVAVFVLLMKYYKYLRNKDASEPQHFFGAAFGSIGAFIYIGWAMSHLGEMVTGFINPEYGALKDIFEFIGKI